MAMVKVEPGYIALYQSGELELALKWTKEALDYLGTKGVTRQEKAQWKPEFQHRLKRLQRKLASKKVTVDG